MYPTPQMGDIVILKLASYHADAITQRYDRSHPDHFHGNAYYEGDEVPMIVSRVWGTGPGGYFSGQAMLDASRTLWVTSVQMGDQPGQCHPKE